MRLAERFFPGRAGSKQSCLCYILYVEEWRFRCNMSSGHRERGFLDPRTPWTDTCDVSGLDSPSTCSHSDDSGGAGVFVPPRTPRSSGYDFFYAHAVYVVICYMSIICYIPVICLVQSPPQEAVVVFGYIEGPFLVSRTGCARERHAPCI